MIDAQICLSVGDNVDPSKIPSLRLAAPELAFAPAVAVGCDVAWNRSCAATDGLTARTSDVLVSIDPDVAWDTTQLSAIVDRARETRGIAAGLYSHEEMPFNFVPFGGHTGRAPRAEGYLVGPGSPQGPTEVDAGATGFLAAHVDVYRAILEAHPELRLDPAEGVIGHWYQQRLVPGPQGSRRLSSDYSFCSYARDAGCAVEILPKIALGHRGKKWWEHLSPAAPSDGFVRLDGYGRAVIARL